MNISLGSPPVVFCQRPYGVNHCSRLFSVEGGETPGRGQRGRGSGGDLVLALLVTSRLPQPVGPMLALNPRWVCGPGVRKPWQGSQEGSGLRPGVLATQKRHFVLTTQECPLGWTLILQVAGAKPPWSAAGV